MLPALFFGHLFTLFLPLKNDFCYVVGEVSPSPSQNQGGNKTLGAFVFFSNGFHFFHAFRRLLSPQKKNPNPKKPKTVPLHFLKPHFMLIVLH